MADKPLTTLAEKFDEFSVDKTQTTKLIWLVIEFDINSGIHRAVASCFEEGNARGCASRLVGTLGKYYSLQSLEIEDAHN